MATPGQVVTSVARSMGIPAQLALAMMRQESGGNVHAVGDNGTSFGLFQLHQGGELGSHSAAWAFNPWNNARTSLEQLQDTPHAGLSMGQWAAAAQRPANQAAYAASIDHMLKGGGLSAGASAGTAAHPPMQSMLPGGGSLGQFILKNNQFAGVQTDPLLAHSIANNGITSSMAKGIGLQSPGQGLVGSGGNQAAVKVAMQQIGIPYVWGGTSTKGFDCSGLVQYAYAKAGINIGRTTYQQFAHGQHINPGQLRPGDLVFSNFEGGSSPTHVVMYIGNGKVVSAAHTGTRISTSPLSWFTGSHYVGARRYSG